MGINRDAWVYMDIHGCTWIYMDIHGYTWLYMDIHRYTWLNMGIHGSTWLFLISSIYLFYIYIVLQYLTMTMLFVKLNNRFQE